MAGAEFTAYSHRWVHEDGRTVHTLVARRVFLCVKLGSKKDDSEDLVWQFTSSTKEEGQPQPIMAPIASMVGLDLGVEFGPWPAAAPADLCFSIRFADGGRLHLMASSMRELLSWYCFV